MIGNSYKKNYVTQYFTIVFFFHITLMLIGQPTSETKIVNLKISVIEAADTIAFINKKEHFISKKKNIKVNFFLQNYDLDIDTRSSKKGKLCKIEPQLINQNTFIQNISPSFQKIGWDRYVPKEDLIIQVKKDKKLMIIYIKLYEINSIFDPFNFIYITIPFKNGMYEIKDPDNPQLILIKEE